MNLILEQVGSVFSAPDSLKFVSGLMVLWGISNLVTLQFTTAPYGRYTRPGWGCLLPAKLAWFLQELPSFVVPLVVLSRWRSDESVNIHGNNKILIGCFLVHYFHRTFIFPLRIRGGKPIPLFPFMAAVFFCSVNGALQTYGILLPNTEIHYWFQKARFCLGIMLFFTGMYINIRSDNLLTSLRKEKEGTYQTPRGFLFEYVSGANFLGEIVEWIGFSVACNNLPSLAFAVFTLCNIGPRAFHHHRFYREKFEDYPKDRKALIPFVL
ncbi:3-oxo-5-alpha-steroid 4-dehydrogenase 2-like isoform X1 [Saccostrea echinata]|uniref:3-oxo-5-alpha-steroid 4-dehydrogenase 2-like isoform X1 n=1 Tax=Saccostrea echinata TaxID=191078 RepID=UPI002A7EE5EA|nr:3-oxo-5-alpha-steroid 4-dehydrogenase 2-like isoform X1 [Saccostrea echinata]